MKLLRMCVWAGVVLAATGCQQSQSSAGEAPSKKTSPAPSSSVSSAGLSDDTVVARWTQDGQKQSLTYGELREARKAKFMRLEQERYEAIKRELEGYVLDTLLEAEAKKAGKTQQAFIDGLAAEVSAEEVKKFYETQVAKGGKGPPLEAVEDRIRKYLSMTNKVPKVKAAAKIKYSLPEPEVPVVEFDLADRPRKGADKAKVTIVEFSDFQCPYCARAAKPVYDIIKAFPEQVEVYFLHFPLSFHQQAMPAAVAARCAQKQGKFWEMHDQIFENQSAMSGDDLSGHAKTLGLDMKKYDSCVEDPATKVFVENDMKQGQEAGVSGTPSFYINGKQHRGPPSVDQIRSLLES